MRPFFLLLVAVLLLDASSANAYRLLGLGKPSARQRQKYSYMLNGRRLKRSTSHRAAQPRAASQTPSA